MCYDIAVIGGGHGGYTAAAKAAAAGCSVVLFEQDELGGTCLNRGCMPTKALLHAAETYHAMTHSESLGLRAEGAGYDFAAMHARKNAVVQTLRQGIEKMMKAGKVTVVKGHAVFAGEGTVLCDGQTW